MKEEVGLTVEVIGLVGVYSKPEQDEIVFLFTCRIVGGKPTLSPEADQIAYFAFAEMPPNTLPKHVERIKDALDQPGKPALKIQGEPASRTKLRQKCGQSGGSEEM